jgi:hypothetical protein
MLAREKHSSLSRPLINYGRKKFYKIWLWMSERFTSRRKNLGDGEKIWLWVQKNIYKLLTSSYNFFTNFLRIP